MGMGRKKALERLEQLLPQLERHLERIREAPEDPSANHYKVEVRGWLRRMEAAIPHLGRRTKQIWIARLRQCRASLEIEP